MGKPLSPAKEDRARQALTAALNARKHPEAPAPVVPGPRLRQAFRDGTEAALDEYTATAPPNGEGPPITWGRMIRMFAATRGTLRARGFSRKIADDYAAAVTVHVADLLRKLPAGTDLRRTVLESIPREPLDPNTVWPRVFPLFNEHETWEEFLAAVRDVFAEANAETAEGITETAAAPGPLDPEALDAAALKAARWTWEKFTTSAAILDALRARLSLDESRPVDLAEIAAEAGADEQTTAAAVDNMERKGYLIRDAKGGQPATYRLAPEPPAEGDAHTEA